MNSIRGSYYDGRSAARKEVLLVGDDENLTLTGDGFSCSYPLAQIRIDSLPGDIGQSIRFPDGSTCTIDAGADLAGLAGLEVTDGMAARLLRTWERSLPLTLGALILTALIVTGLVKYGIPALARSVAFSVPPATDKLLGSETLSVLDRMVFSPSKLSEPRRKEINALFQGMLPDLPERGTYRLEFRSGDRVGANAFALPSGVIVITDGLVNLAKSDNEIMAVLAHEAGHLRNRHALRYLLQNSATGLVIAFITGDILSITSLSATLPTLLINASYSRDFEREADDSAIIFLDRRRIPRKVYADLLARIQADHDRKDDSAEQKRRSSPSDWFSSHPVTEERIRRVQETQQSGKSP